MQIAQIFSDRGALLYLC